MPFSKILVHLIWATKQRVPLIGPELKPVLLSHISQNCKVKNIYLDTLNCVEDHIHLLVSLGTQQTIADVIRMIKGESAFWVNKHKMSRLNFAWQGDYIALSVSLSAADTVRQYIAVQEEHHRKKSFSEEYDLFLKNQGALVSPFG